MYSELLHQAIIASVLAGSEILDVYNTNFDVEYKPDASPVTLADKKASDIIIKKLKQFKFPILSEEGSIDVFEERATWDKLWIIDPLDGTKEFIKRNGEFTVNIALIEKNIPSLGVIYSPTSKDIYFSAKGLGAFKINGSVFINSHYQIETLTLTNLLNLAQKLPIKQSNTNYTVVASRSHMSKETYAHIESLKLLYNNIEIKTTGSSIKLCWIAEGVADEYPRYGTTMEWDTAAGQALLQEANATLIDIETKQSMLYNKKTLVNNWFIAKRN